LQFINYQYRVIKIDKEDKYGTTATVEDTININLQKRLRIIEIRKDTKEFIAYMKTNYNEYRSLAYPNLIEIYYFNKISNLNNKPVVSNKYYITYENYEAPQLFRYVEDKAFEEVLDLAAQLCSAVKYLHLRGYLLCNINMDELSVLAKNQSPILKISSLPYLEGTHYSTMIDKDNNYFKAPEVLQEQEFSRLSDIYLLGAVMFHMFSGTEVGRQNFREALDQFTPQRGTELYKMKKIINKCTALNPVDRYSSLENLMADINQSFNTSYKVIDKQYIKLQPSHLLKLVFRESLMQRLINNAREYLYGTGGIRITYLQGGIGTGKTSFAANATHRLEQEGIKCTKVKLHEHTKAAFGVITHTLREMIKYADKDIIEKYASDLHYILPEMEDVPNTKICQGELNKENKIRLIYRIGNFLLDIASKFPFAVAIVGIEWIDEDSLSVLEYLIKNSDKGKIYFVATISLEAEAELGVIKSSYQILSDAAHMDIIQLSNFNINETAEYIRLILGMDQAPLDFAANIYKETEGNPSYIYELIYLLYNKNLIYVEEDGNWYLKHIDFKKYKLSLNINEIVVNKINNLSNLEKEVLNIISIFNTAISSDILEEMTSLDMETLYELLFELEGANMISKKVDDWGISYDFASINVKKTIYEKIPEKEKLAYHERASAILERKFANENRENRDELIYHMTKANKREDAIRLLIAAGEKMLSSNLINQAIQFLEQGFGLCKKHEVGSNKISICLKLGNLYEQVGDYSKAVSFYDIVERIALNIKDTKVIIDVYINKTSILYKQNLIKSAIKYAVNAKKLLRTVDYIEGLYELILILSDIMMNRRRYSLYISIVERVLSEMEGEKREEYYARFLLVYGRHLWAVRKYENCLPMLLKAEVIFERIGNYKYLTQTLNTIGVCYVESDNDVRRAREYFEKTLIISQKVNNLRYIETSYNNLSELLLMEDKYQEAMENYDRSLQVIKITQNSNLNNLVHANKVLAFTLMEEYKLAHDFIDITDNLFNIYKDSGNFMEFYYRCKAEYYYRLGYYEMSKNYAQRSVDMCITWGISINMESMLLRHLSEIKLTNRIDFRKDLGLCRDIFGDSLYKLGRTSCLQLAEIYGEEGRKEEARQFLQMGLCYADRIETDLLKVHYKYLDAVTGEEEERQSKLEEAAAKMERLENMEIRWKIYKGIAQGCLNRREYQEALKYYISALNMLRKLVHNVPDEYKTTFVLSHSRNTVKEGLRNISEIIMNSKKESAGEQRESGKVTLQNLDKYFDYTNYIDIYREGAKETEKVGSVNMGTYNKLLDKMRQIIISFSDNTIENIKGVVNLCAEVTQAKNAFLATLDEEDNLNILASYNRYLETPFYKYVIEQAKQKKDSIMVTDVFDYNKSKGDLLIPKELTAVFCIPIMSTKEDDCLGLLKERRKQKQGNESIIIGYIYLDTDSIINNFTQECGYFCKILAKMAYILVDNYNLKILSTVDKLTKLYTRKYFETALQNEIAVAGKEGSEFSIIMIDIDKFKSVNDRFGHQKGDEILQGVSGIIMSTLRKEDIPARYGGEEIIILLPGAGEEEGLEVAEKLRKKIENARLLGLHNPLTISLGSAAYPYHSSWAKDLIEKADQALYHAKENGRNQSCLYKEDMSKTAKRIDKLAGIISGNLVEDQRKVETMLEVLELQRSTELGLKEKLFNFLGRIIEVSEAQTGIIFEIGESGEIRNKLARRKFISRAVEEEYYNEELVKKCMESKTGEYRVDWNSYPGLDNVTGMPDWQSIMVVPMSIGGRLAGVLYLSASIKTKEFDAGEYNFIKTLCDIFSTSK
jgi:diguanylate cyclase (GGDEF)-like protein